jgi:hypothetical protein
MECGAGVQVSLEGDQKRNPCAQESQIREKRHRGFDEIGQVQERLRHADVRDHEDGDPEDASDEEEPDADPERDVRTGDPAASLLGFPGHVEELIGDPDKSGFRKPGANPRSHARSGIDNLVGADRPIHGCGDCTAQL